MKIAVFKATNTSIKFSEKLAWFFQIIILKIIQSIAEIIIFQTIKQAKNHIKEKPIRSAKLKSIEYF